MNKQSSNDELVKEWKYKTTISGKTDKTIINKPRNW